MEELLSLAYVLIGLGVLLMLAELLIPTGGLLLLAAGACIVVGVALTFFYGSLQAGMLTLVGVCVILPIVGGVMFYLWPHTPMGKRLVPPTSEDATVVAAMPVLAELEMLRGRIGRTVSPMRPSGVVDFDGRRIDCITEGMMIDANQWVKCIDVKAGRVTVRQIEQPSLDDLENTDFH